MDAVLEKLMKVADKELRRARRKHPQFAGENGFEEKRWPAVLARSASVFRSLPLRTLFWKKRVWSFLQMSRPGDVRMLWLRLLRWWPFS
jgi:hypothetical protein